VDEKGCGKKIKEKETTKDNNPVKMRGRESEDIQKSGV